MRKQGARARGVGYRWFRFAWHAILYDANCTPSANISMGGLPPPHPHYMSTLFPIGNDGKLTSDALSQVCIAMAGNDDSQLVSDRDAKFSCRVERVSSMHPNCDSRGCSLSEIQQLMDRDEFSACVRPLQQQFESQLDHPAATDASPITHKVEGAWNSVVQEWNKVTFPR